jgi:hypothetical protein
MAYELRGWQPVGTGKLGAAQAASAACRAVASACVSARRGGVHSIREAGRLAGKVGFDN